MPGNFDPEAVNRFGQPAMDALSNEMSDFAAHAFTNPTIVAGDTTPADVVRKSLWLRGQALVKATKDPESLTITPNLSLPEWYTVESPYIVRLHQTGVAHKVVGTRKHPYLRAKFTAYARIYYRHDDTFYTDVISRTWVLYLTRNTASKEDLNPRETYRYWWIDRYAESFVDWTATSAPVEVPAGGDL